MLNWSRNVTSSSTSTNIAVLLPNAHSNSNYTVTVSLLEPSNSAWTSNLGRCILVFARSTTSFKAVGYFAAKASVGTEEYSFTYITAGY